MWENRIEGREECDRLNKREDLRHAGVRAVGKNADAKVSRSSTFLSARGKITLVQMARVERWHAMYINRSRQKIYVTQVVERGKPN